MGTALGSTNMASAGMGLVGAGSSISLAIAQQSAADVQGRWEQQQYEFNAKIADFQAEDALERGDIAASRVRAEGRRIKGSQRVAAAAQGIDVNSGSAAEIQDDTELFSELDANTIRSNAYREAFGYKIDAINSRGRGEMGRLGTEFSGKMTLLTGGLSAVQYGLGAARDWSRGANFGTTTSTLDNTGGGSGYQASAILS